MPLLMLVLFGIFEFGRYVVIVQAVETASRNGARFASTTGGSTPHFLDCDAIEDATQDVAVISPADDDIDISYLDFDPVDYPNGVGCQAGQQAPTLDLVQDDTRVLVTVRSQFNAATPIIGKFIDNVTIEVSDERTLVRSRL